MDVIELNRRACAATGAIIDQVRADQLDAPTPCARWTIREIVDHLVTNNRDAVATVAPEGSTLDVGTDFAGTSQAFEHAYADPGVHDRTFVLAGIETDWRSVVAVHFADVLVHGWDIGRAAGLPVELDEDLAAAALRITARFPEHLRGPDGAFDHPRQVADDTPVPTRLLAFLGRDPEWQPV